MTGLRIPRAAGRLAAALVLALVPACAGHGDGGGRRASGAPGGAATTAATAPPTTAPAPSFTLVATGDVLLHEQLWVQARLDAARAGEPGFDFRPVLAGVAPLVRPADLALCHMETPLAPPAGPFHGYPSFSVPPAIAPALADTGYDACSTASNHTFDQGAAGIDRTLGDLDAAGIRHAGSARSPAEAQAVTMLRAGPARVAFLSYTFGFNGIPPPGGQAWRANRIDPSRILADAHRARAAGADVVVVALHWGDEYQSQLSAQQAALGPELARSPDIDLIYGHHVHVVQPIQWVGGKWIAYGLGNLVAFHDTPLPANQEGIAVRFTFTKGTADWRVTRAEYEPLLVARTGPVRVLDVGRALTDPASVPAGGPDRARLRQAWDRTTATVDALGAAAHGLRPVTRVP